MDILLYFFSYEEILEVFICLSIYLKGFYPKNLPLNVKY